MSATTNLKPQGLVAVPCRLAGLCAAIALATTAPTDASAMAFTGVNFGYDVKVNQIFNVTTGVTDELLSLTVAGGPAGGGGNIREQYGNASYKETTSLTHGLGAVAALNEGDRVIGSAKLEARAEEQNNSTALIDYFGFGYLDFFFDAVNNGPDTYLLSLSIDYELSSVSSVQDPNVEAASSFAWMEVLFPNGQWQDEMVRSSSGKDASGPPTDTLSKSYVFDFFLSPGEQNQFGFRSYYAEGRALSIPEPGTAALLAASLAVLLLLSGRSPLNRLPRG